MFMLETLSSFVNHYIRGLIVPCWEYVLKYSYHTPFNKDSFYCWIDSIHNAWHKCFAALHSSANCPVLSALSCIQIESHWNQSSLPHPYWFDWGNLLLVHVTCSFWYVAILIKIEELNSQFCAQLMLNTAHILGKEYSALFQNVCFFTACITIPVFCTQGHLLLLPVVAGGLMKPQHLRSWKTTPSRSWKTTGGWSPWQHALTSSPLFAQLLHQPSLTLPWGQAAAILLWHFHRWVKQCRSNQAH